MLRSGQIFCFIILVWMLGGCVQDPGVQSDVDTSEKFKVHLPEFPDRDFLITDFGAINDGNSLNTMAINKAIEECSSSGGGKVIIPGGVWVTGPLQLKSNVNLHVEAGAIVLFSPDFDEYPYILSYFEGRRDYRAMPLLYGDSLENIAITGKGIFDGSGEAWRPVKRFKTTDRQWNALVASGGVLNKEGNTWWPNAFAYEVSEDPDKFRNLLGDLPDRDKYKAFYRPPLVQLISCKKILLEGPVFQNSPGWCIHPLMCTHLTVDDIQVKNPWYAQNGDGIDVESCSYVSIRNSHFDVGDDAICIKSGKNEEGRKRGMPTQYVDVKNCVVHHGHGGFVVGSEMSGGVKDIWVSDCSFIGTDVGLRFKSTRGRGGVVENIHIDNIRMIGIARDAIIFNLFYMGLAPTEMSEDPVENLINNAPEVSEETPEFRNIHISGINCQGANRALQVLGLPEMPVNGLKLTNSVFRSDRGINCLFANDVEVMDVTVITNNQPTMILHNVIGADITSVEGNKDQQILVDGSKTADIHFSSMDREAATERIVLGKKTKEEALRYSNE